MIKTPVRAPNANAYAERWVRTVRAECLDWLLIVGPCRLEQVLRNQQRPHRALGLDCPDPPAKPAPLQEPLAGEIRRTGRLGGLLHEYARAA